MNSAPNDPSPSDTTSAPKPDASTCGSGCSCHAGKPTGPVRWAIGMLVILAAVLLVARAMIKDKAPDPTSAPAFASIPAASQPPDPARAQAAVALAGIGQNTEKPAAPEAVELPDAKPLPAMPAHAALATPAAFTTSNATAFKEFSALSDLNSAAADTDGVFIYLPGKNEPSIKMPLTQMNGAARLIAAQGQKIGVFLLKTDSRDYEQISKQMPVPGVLAAVKGRGMVPVSGEITETKLVQGFVAATRGGGCGPASAGCGPSGCN